MHSRKECYMFYVPYFSIFLLLCSISLASDKPNDAVLAKASALLSVVAKQIPHTQAYTQEQREQPLAQARAAVQVLDGHLKVPITNIVIECLGSGYSLLKLSDFLSPIAAQKKSSYGSLIEMGTRSFSFTDNAIHFNVVMRMRDGLLGVMASYSEGKWRVKPTLIDAKSTSLEFQPYASDRIRQDIYRNFFRQQKLMGEQTFLNSDGHRTVIRPLDYIPDQGARDFEVSNPDSVPYLLVESDPERFAKHRTRHIISKGCWQDQKKD